MVKGLIKTCAFVGMLVFAAPVTGAENFKVVANSSIQTATISVADLSKIFLKESETWPNGQAAKPVDLAPDSGTRKKFSKDVLGRKVSAIKAFWQRQIFSGKAVPPIEFTSEEDLLFFVSQTPGSVGYVSDTTPLPEGVKEIAVRN